MPQWRKLHVKSIESLDINDMPDDFTRLLWLLMSLVLDKEGRGLDNASWVRSRAMPLRLDVTVEMITEALDWYAERGMIQRYCVNGRKYFHILTWHTYQATDKDAPSIYPAPLQENSASTPDPLQTYSRLTPEQVEEKSITDVDIDKEEDKDKTDSGRLFSLYENEIGLLTPMINEQINDWIGHYPGQWIEDAIALAVQANVRKPKYITGILRNWAKDGRGDVPINAHGIIQISEQLKREGFTNVRNDAG